MSKFYNWIFSCSKLKPADVTVYFLLGNVCLQLVGFNKNYKSRIRVMTNRYWHEDFVIIIIKVIFNSLL